MSDAITLTLIDEQRVHEISARRMGDAIRIAPKDVERTLGWKLEDRGLCRGDACVSLDRAPGLVTEEGIDLAGLAAALDRPLALDVEEGIAALAAPASERAERLASLEAPDFALPDLDGRLHRLSDYRGNKVLLIAHASW